MIIKIVRNRIQMKHGLFIALFMSTIFVSAGTVVKVGYTSSPPFVYQLDSSIKGVHKDMWETIGASLDFETEYVQYSSLEKLQVAIDSNEVSVALNPFVLDTKILTRHDVSTPTYVNSSGIVTKYDFKHRSWYKAMWQIVSFDFIKVSFFVGIVIFLFGFLLWVAERKLNTGHFHNSRKGLIDSFWWSAVTMTTVGYGDKYPVTFAGKLVALIWMFTAMIIISSLTAGITMILTVSNLSSGITEVDDLERLNVGTVTLSTAEQYLSTHVTAQKYLSFSDAMTDLSTDDLDVIAYDKAKITYHIKSSKLHQDYEVLPVELNKELVGFVYSAVFAQKKSVDIAISSIKETADYKEILAREGLE